jgi:DNA repair protein RecO (recombination protein O)
LGSLTTSAIVLRSIDYGESDRVVTLLGRGTGCLGAIARGARKSQRRFGGGLGLCSVGEAALRERGGSELLTLERFDVATTFPSLGADAARMGHAAYVAELLAKLCAPGQAEPAIFDLAISVLGDLDTEGVSPTRLRIFELALLALLGFAPALDECAACGRSDLSVGEAIDVRFIPDRGGVVCRTCAGRGRPMRPVVRVALSNLSRTPLSDAGSQNLMPDVERGCRDALRELIAVHLSAPLRSLEFLSKLENPTPAEGLNHGTAGRTPGPIPQLLAREPT